MLYSRLKYSSVCYSRFEVQWSGLPELKGPLLPVSCTEGGGGGWSIIGVVTTLVAYSSACGF